MKQQKFKITNYKIRSIKRKLLMININIVFEDILPGIYNYENLYLLNNLILEKSFLRITNFTKKEEIHRNTFSNRTKFSEQPSPCAFGEELFAKWRHQNPSPS